MILNMVKFEIFRLELDPFIAFSTFLSFLKVISFTIPLSLKPNFAPLAIDYI